MGCGTSKLSHELFAKGFHHIVNVDFSSALVDRESQKHPEMEWICDDMLLLEKIPTNTVDVVIEKAAIEAVLSNEKVSFILGL